jgi:Zn-dependent peptidase ImmA (M78 family)/transcriptional regulator with XRE-family HTH domain
MNILNGGRLRLARRFVGKDRSEMAALLGVSTSTYASYELGERSFEDKLSRLSELLRVPETFFYRDKLKGLNKAQLSYRKRVSLRSVAAERIHAVAMLSQDFTSVIASKVNLPVPSVPYSPVTATYGVEDSAQYIRTTLKLGDAPIRNVIELVEYLGVQVFWVNGDVEFDGVSFWRDDVPYILINSLQADGYRMRFTVLHELGHLVLHRIAPDADAQEIERQRLDREADRFASAMLFPPSAFSARWPKIPTIDRIFDDRSYWRASSAAMVRRAKDLHLISDEVYRRLCVTISARGWRKGEPSAPPHEQSRVHQFFLDEIGEYGLTASHIGSWLDIPTAWVEEMMPLSKGYQTSLFDLADL